MLVPRPNWEAAEESDVTINHRVLMRVFQLLKGKRMYLSAHLDPKPHQKASPGQQVAGPRCLKSHMGEII